MTDVFPAAVFYAPRSGCTAVKSASKHWPCLFPQHGPGAKHTRQIELAEWQREIIARYPEKFARGLFHSDGTRVTNRIRRWVGGEWKYYEYPRYFFSNTSDDIVALLTEALDLLDVRWKYRLKRNDHHQDTRIISVA